MIIGLNYGIYEIRAGECDITIKEDGVAELNVDVLGLVPTTSLILDFTWHVQYRLSNSKTSKIF